MNGEWVERPLQDDTRARILEQRSGQWIDGEWISDDEDEAEESMVRDRIDLVHGNQKLEQCFREKYEGFDSGDVENTVGDNLQGYLKQKNGRQISTAEVTLHQSDAMSKDRGEHFEDSSDGESSAEDLRSSQEYLDQVKSI